MKKIVLSVLLVAIAIGLFTVSSFASTVYFETEEEYTDLGVNVASKDEADADPSIYNVEGLVVNFRVSKSPGNFKEAYDERWLAPGWGSGYSKESSLYLGDRAFDMSKITSITIDWLANKGPGKTNIISLSKDAAGTEVVATVNITELDLEGNMAEKFTSTLTVTDTTYNGPLYLYMKAETRMFIGNLRITSEDSATEAPTQAPATEAPTEAPATDEPTQAPTAAAPATDAPATEAPATSAPSSATQEEKDGGCGSSSAIAQVMLVLGAALIIKKRK